MSSKPGEKQIYEDFETGIQALEEGAFALAQTAFESHLKNTPQDAEGWANLALACFLQRNYPLASQHWKTSLKSEWLPEVAENISDNAFELVQEGNFQTAAELYGLLVERMPQLRGSLIWALRCANQTHQAEQLLQGYLKQDPHNLELRLLDSFLLPQFYASTASMGQWRQRLRDKLQDLKAWLAQKPEFTGSELIVGSPIFDLMLLGQNEKETLEAISTIWRQLFLEKQSAKPTLQQAARPLRIAWVSFSLYQHSTMDYFKGLIRYFCQDPDFCNGVFYFGKPRDSVTEEIAHTADHFVQLELSLETGLTEIRAWQPDILFYLDIGQEAMLYTLAHYRLAKLQCVSSGIPITTGISTIDYYLSCHSFEPEQAQQNYSEKLIALPNPPWQVEVPPLSSPLLNRADLGLPPDKTLYLFPHTLFRLDPDLDPIIASLFAADPQAVLVLLRYRETRLHEDLQKRLSKILSAADLERICFLPWLPQSQFLQLLNLADLALDGLYLGGGLVSYQCFAMGLPIIHLPTEQLRCRVAAGLYHMAGLSEWIAQDKADYLQKALQLGQDPALRSQLKSQIQAARPLIFENRQGPKDLAAFFRAQF